MCDDAGEAPKPLFSVTKKTFKILRSATRDNAPPDAKPLVICWHFFENVVFVKLR